MSKNKYFILSMFFTVVLSSLLLLFSTYVKKISKSYSDLRDIYVSAITTNNTNDISLINDTLYFGQSIMKEFYENQIDTNCKKIFFVNNTPNNKELNNFLFFFFTTIQEFSMSYYSYSSFEDTTKISILSSSSEDIIITFEITKTNNTPQIKNIIGIGKFMRKICPILIK